MKKAQLVFFLVISGFVFVPSVLGCMCKPPGNPAKEMKGSAAVFSGKLIGTEYRKGVTLFLSIAQPETKNGETAQTDVLVLKFQIDRWWKGRETREVVLFTDQTKNPDGSQTITDCDFPFEVGKQYLVYAFRDEGKLKTNLCTRTKLLEKAGEDLKILGKGRRPRRSRQILH